MAFVPCFSIPSAKFAPNLIDAVVTVTIITTRGNSLTIVGRYIVSPSSPTPITRAQVFAACKALANTLQANEDTAAAAVPPADLHDPVVYDATQAGATPALPANIAPLTGLPPLDGVTV